MKFTITGSLGNIGKPLATQLASSGHEVTVISSDADKKEAIEKLGAIAKIGSVLDTEFLKNAFKGADAVFVMTPPNLGGSNVIANTVEAGKALAQAISESGVKRVVMLSSIGADLTHGTGPIAGLHQIEKLYGKLENIALTIVRAGFFYTNLYNDIPMIKNVGILGSNYPETLEIPFVHPNDIAIAVAEELQKNSAVKNIRYVISDIRTPREFTKILGNAINKPELPWIEFSDEQALSGMIDAGLPEEIAKLYTEMGAGLRTEIIVQDFRKNGSPIKGKTKFEDFANEFSLAF